MNSQGILVLSPRFFLLDSTVSLTVLLESFHLFSSLYLYLCPRSWMDEWMDAIWMVFFFEFKLTLFWWTKTNNRKLNFFRSSLAVVHLFIITNKLYFQSEKKSSEIKLEVCNGIEAVKFVSPSNQSLSFEHKKD